MCSGLITGDMASGKEGGVSQPADLNMSPVVVSAFKLMLGAFGPTFSTQKFVQVVNVCAFQGTRTPCLRNSMSLYFLTASCAAFTLSQNCKENEPFFLGVATAIAVAGNPPAWGANALYLYCASRFGHAILFFVDWPEALLPYQVLVRATPYLIGVFTMFRLAGNRLA